METYSSPSSTINSRQRKIWPLVIGLIVSVAALLLFYLLVDLDAVATTLRQAHLIPLAAALFIIYPLAIIARAYRWWLLLRKRISWSRGLHIINIGYMANMIFPARLGEVVRLVLVRNEPAGDGGQAISAVAIERLVDVLFALLSIAIGLALLGDATSLPPEIVSSLSFFLVVVVIGFGFLFFTPPLHPVIIRIVSRILQSIAPQLEARITSLVLRTLTSMQQLANPVRLTAILGWSTITWVLYALFYHAVLLAFVDKADIGASILATGFIALSISVPSVPSYAGPFHVGAALALNMYGFDEAVGASFALTSHAMATLLTIAIGVYSMQKMQTSFKTLREFLPSFPNRSTR